MNTYRVIATRMKTVRHMIDVYDGDKHIRHINCPNFRLFRQWALELGETWGVAVTWQNGET